MHDETDGPNNDAGLSAYKIRRHLEGSLRRLQTDHVELYQMHHVDPAVSWDELWGLSKMLSIKAKLVMSDQATSLHGRLPLLKAKPKSPFPRFGVRAA